MVWYKGRGPNDGDSYCACLVRRRCVVASLTTTRANATNQRTQPHYHTTHLFDNVAFALRIAFGGKAPQQIPQFVDFAFARFGEITVGNRSTATAGRCGRRRRSMVVRWGRHPGAVVRNGVGGGHEAAGRRGRRKKNTGKLNQAVTGSRKQMQQRKTKGKRTG